MSLNILALSDFDRRFLQSVGIQIPEDAARPSK